MRLLERQLARAVKSDGEMYRPFGKHWQGAYADDELEPFRRVDATIRHCDNGAIAKLR